MNKMLVHRVFCVSRLCVEAFFERYFRIDQPSAAVVCFLRGLGWVFAAKISLHRRQGKKVLRMTPEFSSVIQNQAA